MGLRVTFSVPGKPSRWMRPGEFTDPKTGITRRTTDKAAEAGKKNIAKHAGLAWGGRLPVTGPLILRVVAIFEIPESWPPALKRAAAQARVMHVADPDLDQLVKQVKDALKGIVYVDDNQVCGYPNSAKRYGGPMRTEITIEVLDQKPDEITPGQKRLEKRIEQEGWAAVLAPPKRRKAREAHVPAAEGKGHKSAPRGNQTKSKTETGPTALQRAIDAALARDDMRRLP